MKTSPNATARTRALRPSSPSPRASGFTLVEMVVVITIMTIVAGVAVPVAGKLFNREATKATRTEMRAFDDATRMYFADTGVLPTTAGEFTTDSGVAGWAGPYLSGGVDAASLDFAEDAWDNAYNLSIAGDVWTLTSNGPDRTAGTTDDLVLTVDVTPERRSTTFERLEVINLAIRLYNEDWLSPPSPSIPDPLSTSWPTAHAQLVSRGYLPNDPEYATDGWGVDFQSVGGVAPVVAVESTLGS